MSKQTTPRHVIFKVQNNKDKEKNPEISQRNKTHCNRETKIRITSNFFSETMQVRKGWSEIFKKLRGKRTPCENSILYEMILQKRRDIKTFSDK